MIRILVLASLTASLPQAVIGLVVGGTAMCTEAMIAEILGAASAVAAEAVVATVLVLILLAEAVITLRRTTRGLDLAAHTVFGVVVAHRWILCVG